MANWRRRSFQPSPNTKLLLAHGPGLIETAREVSRSNLSYRGFGVGAAALMRFADGTTQVVTGTNVKRGRGMPKLCAEQMIFRKLETENSPGRIAVLAVCGPLQPDIESELETPTFDPCGPCRRLFYKPWVQRWMDDGTLIVTAQLEEDVYEIHTRDELRDRHTPPHARSWAVHEGLDWPSLWGTVRTLSSPEIADLSSLPPARLARTVLQPCLTT